MSVAAPSAPVPTAVGANKAFNDKVRFLLIFRQHGLIDCLGQTHGSAPV